MVIYIGTRGYGYVYIAGFTRWLVKRIPRIECALYQVTVYYIKSILFNNQTANFSGNSAL